MIQPFEIDFKRLYNDIEFQLISSEKHILKFLKCFNTWILTTDLHKQQWYME